MDKDKLKEIKRWIDVSIDFLKLISKYLGDAVAQILFPGRKK